MNFTSSFPSLTRDGLFSGSAVSPLWNVLAWLAMLLGAVLRLYQWWAGGSFWVDELALVRNIADRPLPQLLFAPLDYAQVAPPLFLFLQKVCWWLFGDSDRALRVVPLLASLALLPLMLAVARRVLDARLVPLAVLTLAISYEYVALGGQAKQYAGEVAAALFITWLCLRLQQEQTSLRWKVGAALAGVVVPLFAPAAVLVLTGCGAVLLGLAMRHQSAVARRETAGIVTVWAFGSLVALLWAHAVISPNTQRYLRWFWQEGFLSPNAHLPAELLHLLTDRYNKVFGWPRPHLWVWATVLGAGVLSWRRHTVALVLLAPWFVAIGAALLQQYPMQQRTMHYLLPSLTLCFFAGVEGLLVRVEDGAGRLFAAGVALGAAVPLLLSINAERLPPFQQQNVHPLYSALAQARRPGDAVYAYYGAGQSLLWYGPRLGLQPATYQLSGCHRGGGGSMRAYLRELDAYRGRARVWVVFVHGHGQEVPTLEAYLDAIGTRRGSRLEGRRRMPGPYYLPPPYAQLYDLSDTARLARASADTFSIPVVPANAAEQHWGCYGPHQALKSR
ncbi:hypothetical protein F0P96_00135 [Hymenobacter busanensis]|uniref:Glycosyltransferase RgtA/B/C/D-like domain-containing protein n=1 Tax=Hymenobacter busanensis TaxID=2607656 RepID=A0A7L4ZWD1_9BACT|nr:glycosyltransferase family 39 protein [Hymenobacter busanensis]KAA9339083.1 hypothetical protein F0P96_00135 [Hymenobacter busanensis]QHJ07155.1 hypothetical protein GUY19_07615 [Hymenobacter busanensis]